MYKYINLFSISIFLTSTYILYANWTAKRNKKNTQDCGKLSPLPGEKQRKRPKTEGFRSFFDDWVKKTEERAGIALKFGEYA